MISLDRKRSVEILNEVGLTDGLPERNLIILCKGEECRISLSRN
jgi:hypothetical protein